MNEQVKRLLVAGVAVPLAMALVWDGGLPLVGLLVLLAVLGTREFFDLAERAGGRPLRGLGLLLAGLAPLMTWVWVAPVADRPSVVESFVAALLGPIWLWLPWPLAGILIPLIVLATVLFRRAPSERPVEAAGTTLLGPLYAGVLPSALLLIRFDAGPERSFGAMWLALFPFAVTWLGDSFAMWGGMLFGKRKLWPAVSPGKTWTGSVIGLIGGVVVAIAYVLVAPIPPGRPISILEAAVMGVVISIVAQIGDLVESVFKRAAGVKDSSGILPGHGGVLDRLDSLYFVLPAVAVMFRVLEIGG